MAALEGFHALWAGGMATIEDHSDVVFHANRTFVPERICNILSSLNDNGWLYDNFTNGYFVHVL